MNREVNNGQENGENQLYPWSQTDSAKMNPILIMARIMAARPEFLQRIEIRDVYGMVDAASTQPELLPQYNDIYADSNAQDILWRINDTPELKALADAFTSLLEPDFDISRTTTWNDNTKRGVQALYHLNRAKREVLSVKEWAQRGKEWGDYMKASVASQKKQAEDLFAAGAIHITIKVMRELVAQVVARALDEQTNL